MLAIGTENMRLLSSIQTAHRKTLIIQKLNYKTVASVKYAFKTWLALLTANINWCRRDRSVNKLVPDPKDPFDPVRTIK